jgi:hypothetical protein
MTSRFATLLLVTMACSSAAPPRAGTGGAGDEGGTGGATGGSGQGGSAPDAATVTTTPTPTGGAGGTGGSPAGTGGSPAGTGGTEGAGWLETVQVPASGESVAMKTTLDTGELYLLKATGSADFGAQKVDAEFSYGSGMPLDQMGAVDYGVDIGLLQIHPKVHTTPTPPGPGRMKWLPTIGYREDHVYYVTVTGEGKPLSMKLGKPEGSGAGAISVSLARLSPAPPPSVGKELETVGVPLTKTVVSAMTSTESGKLYLVQASGEGKVSKGGVGDAEYMDYDPAGTRFNEGEGGADFGVGVDEIEVGLQPRGPGGYKPRLRWWGTWRKDHTYYLLFAGTGKPIQFLYFDSGYGDNGPMDKITVKIFPAP